MKTNRAPACHCGAYLFPHRANGGKCHCFVPMTAAEARIEAEGGVPYYLGVDPEIVRADQRERARDMNLAAKGK